MGERWIERQNVNEKEKIVYYILDEKIGEYVYPPTLLELSRKIVFDLDSHELGVL